MGITRRRLLSGSITSFIGAGVVSEFLTPTLADNTSTNPEDIPQVIGHRGFSDNYPDNSLVGFKAAHEAGADGVEVDVRETKDGKLVASHDWFAMDSPEGANLIEAVTWTKLQTLNPNIPLFRDVLEFVERTDLDLYIELKVNRPVKVRSMLEEYDISGDVVFIAFENEWLEPIKDDYVTALIGTVPSEWLLYRAEKYDHNYALPHFTSASSMKTFFRQAEQRDVKTGYWAISSDESDIMLGLESSPDIVITNNPKEATSLLKST